MLPKGKKTEEEGAVGEIEMGFESYWGGGEERGEGERKGVRERAHFSGEKRKMERKINRTKKNQQATLPKPQRSQEKRPQWEKKTQHFSSLFHISQFFEAIVSP